MGLNLLPEIVCIFLRFVHEMSEKQGDGKDHRQDHTQDQNHQGDYAGGHLQLAAMGAAPGFLRDQFPAVVALHILFCVDLVLHVPHNALLYATADRFWFLLIV